MLLALTYLTKRKGLALVSGLRERSLISSIGLIPDRSIQTQAQRNRPTPERIRIPFRIMSGDPSPFISGNKNAVAMKKADRMKQPRLLLK